ncbi:phage terminase [Mycobacteroides abscessus subsp. abscessus]|uniref:terminase large subunit n=1 Tax=Mycobacteroides abscessus TaxID=36809 RepID=UPI00092C6560|nr:terminase large subunit [Mycobacteroides abscessus]SHT43459.1 phage terminase [Mycobacteroides abscessus subsp. abscessus]SLK74711.1 phage terminase [Mycobacteroides abscessus subsp. abscessus]
MRRGPKGDVDESPLPFRPRKKGVERFEAFVRKYLVVPKGKGANKPMRLRPWQVEMLRPFLDPDPRPVVGAIMGPRGLGKTGLFAALGLYELFTGPDGNEIPIVAVDERMAGRLLTPAAQMVELHPELASRAVVYRDRIEVPGKRSTLTALPAEAKRIEGLGTWTLALADELGEIDPDTWSTLLLGAGKLDGAMALGIGTPPNRETSVLTDLREQARADPDDKTMAFVEFSADGFEDHPASCVHCLELANPQLDDLLSRDRATALLKQTTEGEYRRKRLCQVVVTNESPFLAAESWDALGTGQAIPDGAEVVLGVDASLNNDSTAIVVGTVAARPHFDKLDVWEKPAGDNGWQVPILDVEQAIRDAAKRWKVREVAYDPKYFSRSAAVLLGEGLPMVVWDQTPRRQTPATKDLQTGALQKLYTHSGDPDLRRHVLASTVKESDVGIRLAKTSRSRHAQKIDLCVALMMAHSRSTWLAAQQKPRARYGGA